MHTSTPVHSHVHVLHPFIELNDFIVIIVWQGQYRSSSFMKNDSFQTQKKADFIPFFLNRINLKNKASRGTEPATMTVCRAVIMFDLSGIGSYSLVLWKGSYE